MIFQKQTIWLFMAAAFLSGCGDKENGNGQNARKPAGLIVQTLEIKTAPLQETLSAPGSLLAWEAIELRTERAGVIRELHFEEGRPAGKGDLLVKVDDSELQAELQRAEAQRQLAANSERRQRELLRSKGISAAEYDESLANLNVAEANMKLIRAQIAKTEIRAPFDGIAGLRNASVGAYLTPDTVIGTFRDTRSLKLDFTLPERYAPLLKSGMQVRFTVAGHTRKFEGNVYAVEPGIHVETRSLRVRAYADNSDRKLVPGAFAEVEVILEEIPEAIVIPPSALVPGLREQNVFLFHEGNVEMRAVEVGLRTSHALQIVSGLSPGEMLITTGLLQLRPGMQVQPAQPTQ